MAMAIIGIGRRNIFHPNIDMPNQIVVIDNIIIKPAS